MSKLNPCSSWKVSSHGLEEVLATLESRGFIAVGVVIRRKTALSR